MSTAQPVSNINERGTWMLLSDPEQALLEKEKLTNLMLFFAMLVSVCSLLLVVMVLPGFGEPSAQIQSKFFFMAFAIIAFTMAILAYSFRFVILRKRLSKPIGSPEDTLVADVSKIYRTHCLISFAMAEGIAALGLVLYFMEGNKFNFVGFFVLGLIMLLICRPSGYNLNYAANLQKEMAAEKKS